MKRFLHALAVLWPGREISLRTGPAPCEVVRNETAKPQKSETASYTLKIFIGQRPIQAKAHQRFSKSANLPLGIALATILFMCLTAAQQVSAQQAEPADAAVMDIEPLQIGDTIPEYLWHMPLEVVNHPEGKDTITLNDYRGKTILLDFLSTGCAGCIAAIPKLEALMAEFGEEVYILPITPQKRDQVTAFIPKNRHVNQTELPFVVEDEILKNHFPHLYISHVVWVDAVGTVRATTNANHVTSQTLQEFLSGEPLDWPVKTENTLFFNAPIATLNEDANVLYNNRERLFYYAAITGYTEGIGPYKGAKKDSLKSIDRVSFRNRSIYELYRIALAEHFTLTQVILETEDRLLHEVWNNNSTSLTRDQWNRKYAMCYERTIPAGTPKKTWQKLMLDDLNNFLQLNGRMETRNGKRYFVLSKKSELR